jgi:hypothetical protein
LRIIAGTQIGDRATLSTHSRASAFQSGFGGPTAIRASVAER